jgi:hypothetical protein
VDKVKEMNTMIKDRSLDSFDSNRIDYLVQKPKETEQAKSETKFIDKALIIN